MIFSFPISRSWNYDNNVTIYIAATNRGVQAESTVRLTIERERKRATPKTRRNKQTSQNGNSCTGSTQWALRLIGLSVRQSRGHLLIKIKRTNAQNVLRAGQIHRVMRCIGRAGNCWAGVAHQWCCSSRMEANVTFSLSNFVNGSRVWSLW